MKRTLTAAALALAASSAMACTPTFGAHVATYHFDRSAGYNEVNLGAYAMCDGYTAGIYHNSQRTTSAYVGYTVALGPVDVTLGAVTGYRRGTLPMIVPSVKVGDHTRIAFLPPIPGEKHNTGGVHLMLEF